MSAKQDYWSECIALAAEECGLVLTSEQLKALAGAAEIGHENYGMAFYTPPLSDRIASVDREWKDKLRAKEAELDRYQVGAETAIKTALRMHRDSNVSINYDGSVYKTDGRTVRVL